MKNTNFLGGLAATLQAATLTHAFHIPSLPGFDYGRDITLYSSSVADLPSSVEMTSTVDGPFDGPKVKPVNSTSFDWWYFDVVDEDASQSCTFTFYSSAFSGLGFGPEIDTINWVHVSGAFSNGTRFEYVLPANTSVVATNGDGSAGSWDGSGISWVGTPDLLEYTVTAADPTTGVSGTMKISSRAPAHFPCGTNEPGQSEEVVPGVGWANSIPDGAGEVNVKIGDTIVQFSGPAYHDKNWGNKPFIDSVGSWYWGHGRVGDYSIVWFDTLDPQAKEYLSAYAVKDGAVASSSCGSIKVRPTGENATYPPLSSTGNPSAFSIEMDLGAEGTLTAIATNELVTDKIGDVYTRYIGHINGTLNGIQLETGVGLWEQFKVLASWP